MQTDHKHIILFDGICNFCNGIVTFILTKDKRGIFRFAALQSDTGQELLKQYGLPVDDFDSFVYIYNNRCYIKSDAALLVAKEFGYPWRITTGLRILPMKFRNWIYDHIAASRYRIFGKMDTCMVPEADQLDRFL